MGGENRIIEEQVRKLHSLVRFTAPPLDLAEIFERRPDIEVQLGEDETPLELQSEGDRLIITMPPLESPYDERMLLSHALGHAMLHPVPVLCEGGWSEEEISLDEPGSTADVLKESQAHSFALELLMPMEMFEEHTEMQVTLFMKGQEVESEVERLVPIFGAPPEAVLARIHRLMERHLRLHSGGIFRKD